MGTPPHKKPKSRDESEGASALIGWVFVVFALFAIVFMILHAKPQGRFVCDTDWVSSPTKFGYCRTE